MQPLNFDVYSCIADYLDLPSALRLSMSTKILKDAVSTIPLQVLLLRDIDIEKVSKDDITNEVWRLISNHGLLSEDNKVRSQQEHLRFVRESKLSALIALIGLLKANRTTIELKEIIEEFFNQSILEKNREVSRLLLSVKQNDVRVLSQDFLQQMIQVACGENNWEILSDIVTTISFSRIDVDVLKECARRARKEQKNKFFMVVLALICRCEPNLAAVNELISTALFSTAEAGQEELCLELAKMFQLRVRFKKLRLVEDNQAQNIRLNAAEVSEINEELEAERLREEAGDIKEAMKVFKRSLQSVLETACRNNHTSLARKLLESKMAGEVDDAIIENFFKTAIGVQDIDTATYLVKGKKLNLGTLCDYFIGCARRNHIESIKMLLLMDVVPNPTIEIAHDEAVRRHHGDLAQLLSEALA